MTFKDDGRLQKTKTGGLRTKKKSGKGKLPEQMRAQQTAHEFFSDSSPYQGISCMPVGVKTSIVLTKILPLLLWRADVDDINDILSRISLGES